MKLHAKIKGNVGEMAVAKDLMLKGYSVFYELGDNSRIDLIAEKNNNLFKIQVKALTSRNGEYVELKGYKTGPNYSFRYDRNDIDVFAIYVLDLDKIVYLSSNFLEYQNTITIRFKPTKNNQTKSCHLFKDYISFENALSDLE